MRRINQSWRDEQATTGYPFSEHTTPTTTLGLSLPSGVLLDALIHAANSQGGYYLERIDIESDTILFSIFDDTNSPVATGIWGPRLNDKTTIPLRDLQDRRAGVLVVDADELSLLLNSWGDGEHSFLADTSGFLPTTWEYAVIAEEPQDVAGVLVYSNEDLYLVAENGVRLECKEANGQSTVVVHAVGDPLSRRNDCGETFVTPRFVRELVFQHGAQTVKCQPSGDGNSNIIVTSHSDTDSALRIQNSPAGIKLGFMAAKP